MSDKGRTDAQRLQDIIAALRIIRRDTEGMSSEQFEQDGKTQRAVAFVVMAVGEAAGRISARTRNAHPIVNWRRIAQYREAPAHVSYEPHVEAFREFVRDQLPILEHKINKVRPAPETTS